MFGTSVNTNNSNFNNIGEKEKTLEEEVLEMSRRRAQVERERRLAANPFMPRKTLLPIQIDGNSTYIYESTMKLGKGRSTNIIEVPDNEITEEELHRNKLKVRGSSS